MVITRPSAILKLISEIPSWADLMITSSWLGSSRILCWNSCPS